MVLATIEHNGSFSLQQAVEWYKFVACRFALGFERRRENDPAGAKRQAGVAL
jgi:hypothetical protein